MKTLKDEAGMTREARGALRPEPNAAVGAGAVLGGRAALSSGWLVALAVLSLALGAALFEGLMAGQSSSVAPATARSREHVSRQSLLSLPLAARGPVSAALGADSPAYRVAAAGGALTASNPAQHLSASFTSSGVSVASGGARLGLSLRGVGHGSTLGTLASVAPRAHGNHVLYTRAGVSEWYANGPLGLEQGFTLAHNPAGHGAGPLTLSIVLSGNTLPLLADGAQSITFMRNGKTALRYTGLSATDASGHALHSWLSLQGARLLVHVDAAGARFPIRIDPLLQQGKKLGGTEEIDHSDFGYSVALSAEGNTALIGGREDDSGVGAAWVFTRSGSTWSQQGKKLTSSESSTWFGYSVSLSAEGNTALIGAPETEDAVGAAWVFTRSGSTWTQQGKKLTGSGEEGAEGAIFGWSVSLSADGNTALIGGPFNDNAVGAAWVFTRSGSTWTQQAKLTGGEESGAPEFGEGVALSADGNTALIGGPVDDNVGAAWVFTRSGSTWTQQGKKLTGPGESGKGYFGFSVALSEEGSTALVGGFEDNGDVGAAWVFTRTDEKWTAQGKKLTGSEESGAGDFGYSVALSASGNTALIGGRNDDSGLGAAWLFTRSSEKWTQQGKKLTGSEESGNADFGQSVALDADGQIALVGGPFDGSDGAAWAFVNSPTVTTDSASEVKLTSATLNATVNPEGSEVGECKFEYGTTSAYGSTAKCASPPGAGEIAVAVSAPLTGLAEDTTYHYRISATNGHGTSTGADQTLTTLITSKSATTKESKTPAEVTDGPLSAKASEGTGSVTVGQYGSDPGGTRLLGSGGGYIDVYQGTEGTFKKIEFKDCELGRAKTLYWFNPEAGGGTGEWQQVTRQTYIAGSPACIKVESEATGTSPTLAQMKGTRYGSGTGVAVPEFGECAGAPTKMEGSKTLYEGFFTKNSCTIKSEGSSGAGTGKYEWEVEALQKTTFKTAASAVKLESALKTSKITCTGESGEGEYTGQKSLAALTLKLTGCSRGAEQCTSADAAGGEIVTSTLEGVLGWESITSDKVALALYPKTGPFMEFKCGTASISVRGSVIAPVKANKMLSAQALKFKGSKGKQVPESFEDEAKDVLEWSSNGGPYEQAGLSATITQTNPTEVEINSAF